MPQKTMAHSCSIIVRYGIHIYNAAVVHGMLLCTTGRQFTRLSYSTLQYHVYHPLAQYGALESSAAMIFYTISIKHSIINKVLIVHYDATTIHPSTLRYTIHSIINKIVHYDTTIHSSTLRYTIHSIITKVVHYDTTIHASTLRYTIHSIINKVVHYDTTIYTQARYYTPYTLL